MGLGKKIMQVFIKADNSDLEKKLNKSKSSVGNFGNTVKKIGGLVAGAFTVQRVVEFGKEAVRLANEMEGVAAAFERIGNERILEGLRRATKNTVTDLELMRRAVMASNFDIPIENLASLFEFATKRAQETGQSIDYLVNSIVLGIGRKSPLILDNLGISAIKLRQELKGTGVEMTSVADVAAAVGRIAAEEMEKAGEIIETNAVRLEQLRTQWKNLQTEMGKGISTYFLEGVDNAISTVNVLKSDYLTFWDKLKSVGNPAMMAYASAMAEVGQEIDSARKDVTEDETVARVIRETEARLQAAKALKAEAEEKEKAKAIAAAEAEALQKEHDALRDLNHQRYLAKLAINEKTKASKEASEQAFSEDIPATLEQLSVMADLELQSMETAETINASAYVIGKAFEGISNIVKQVGVDMADSFAVGVGAVTAGVQTFGDVLGDLSSMILAAIGDIMIMVGTYALQAGQLEVGIPLLLGGLAMKGLGSFVSNRRERKQAEMGLNSNGIPMQSTSTLYGNDIRTANAYATDVYNRVG